MIKKNIIFDLDGTLINSAPSILACFSRVLKANGISPLISLADSVIGPPLITTLKMLSGIQDDRKLEQMANQFKDYYDLEACLLSPPYLGVDEGLIELASAKFNLHIATNKRHIPTKNIVKNLGWENLFSSIYTLDQSNSSFKSKSEMIAHQLNAFDLLPSQTIYVGDRVEDLHAASDNNLKFVGVSWGYGEFPPSAYVIQSFNQLSKVAN